MPSVRLSLYMWYCGKHGAFVSSSCTSPVLTTRYLIVLLQPRGLPPLPIFRRSATVPFAPQLDQYCAVLTLPVFIPK
jgi:hypothetical protein